MHFFALPQLSISKLLVFVKLITKILLQVKNYPEEKLASDSKNKFNDLYFKARNYKC